MYEAEFAIRQIVPVTKEKARKLSKKGVGNEDGGGEGMVFHLLLFHALLVYIT